MKLFVTRFDVTNLGGIYSKPAKNKFKGDDKMREYMKILMDKKFEVLNCIAEHSVKINEELVCPLSQNVLAKELNMARMTFSRYLHALINSGFIKPRGNIINRYTLTELGIKVIKTINRL